MLNIKEDFIVPRILWDIESTAHWEFDTLNTAFIWINTSEVSSAVGIERFMCWEFPWDGLFCIILLRPYLSFDLTLVITILYLNQVVYPIMYLWLRMLEVVPSKTLRVSTLLKKK